MEEGKEVSFLPSYGAEMRGGTLELQRHHFATNRSARPSSMKQPVVMAHQPVLHWISLKARCCPARPC